MTASAVPPILDARQLIRIESVHRGFLYQHLYGVLLALQMPGSDIVSLAIERDEDIEVRRLGDTLYLQVKSRQAPLQPNDIAGALERFEDIREAHARGDRAGAARFAIVCNSEPSPVLATQADGADWPADVELVTPGRPSRSGLPLPSPANAHALAACEAAAGRIPFPGLSPATLALKLAALMQFYAAGQDAHVINAAEVSEMLEQIVAQLQDLPEPPRPFFPQRDEPEIMSEDRVRLIVGFSGAGKTAWASEAARHRKEPIAYFDVAGLPSAAVATNLGRELVARFLGAKSGAPKLPPGAGLDVLRAADALLREQGTRPLVILDNAHELSAEDFRRVVDAAPNCAFLALAQPWPDRAFVEARLQITAEQLSGYDPDTVARVCASEGVSVEMEDALGILSLTGGLPLYVASAARLAAEGYGGSAREMITAIRAQANAVETAQEVILERSFAGLSAEGRDAAALLGLCDVPITDDEAIELLADLGAPAMRAKAMRELRRASMLVSSPRGVALHDALRPIAGGHAAGLPAEQVEVALVRLHALLMLSLVKNSDIPRLTFMVRLLPRIGLTDALVDLATSEMFYEQGNHAVIYDTVVASARDETLAPNERFWSLDALAYWQSRDGGTPEREIIEQMARLVAENPEFELRERLNLLFKQLVVAGTDKDRRAIDKLSATGRRLTKDAPLESRLFRYNRAVALYRAEAYGAVRNTLEPLIDETFKVLGFAELALLGANGPALLELLSEVDDRDDVKRAADMLGLWASAVSRTGHAPGLRRIQAIKLFAASGAGRSAVNSAMDGADEFLDFMAQPEGAREMLELHVLPLIEHYGLTDLMLPARGQYAVVLAYCGDFESADREVAALRKFGGDPDREAELSRQSALIDEIRAGRIVLGPQRPQQRGVHLVFEPNRIGRATGPDEACPCGSGRKNKRCCGKRRA